MKYIFFLVLLIMGCNNKKPVDFCNFSNYPDDSEIYFQINIRSKEILVAVNTNGIGTGHLQLFKSNGELIEDVLMDNVPFEISKWDDNSVEITFFSSIGIGMRMSDSLNHLKHENQFNPKKIGKYGIKYIYSYSYSGGSTKSITIDSVYIDRNRNIVDLFFKNSLIKELPIDFLQVYDDRFIDYSDIKSRIIIEYIIEDKRIIKKSLKNILSK
jgi:hypothetical protein